MISAIKEIISKCKDLEIPIFVDSKRKNLACFEGCIVKINKSEYDLSTSLPSSHDIIVTTGRDGAIWNGEVFSAAKSEIDDLEISSGDFLRGTNVCGAGDTFLSGLITEYLISGDMRKSIKFANYCASKSVEKFGTYVVSLEDLK